jgi:hypothetical protein
MAFGLGPRAGGVIVIFLVGVVVTFVLDLGDRFGWWPVAAVSGTVIALLVLWDQYELQRDRRANGVPPVPPCTHGGIGAILGPGRCRHCRAARASAKE